MGFILFILAYILFLPLTLLNWLLVRKKGYFRQSALNLDIYANSEFRTLWNTTLQKNGYKFGKVGETISSAIGKNIQNGTLTKIGKILVLILTEKHCIDAINWKL
ncbi:MAG: hypothetical protein RIS64_3938 [Bacteroidota bacterium]|jgi:hypothetical protein